MHPSEALDTLSAEYFQRFLAHPQELTQAAFLLLAARSTRKVEGKIAAGRLLALCDEKALNPIFKGLYHYEKSLFLKHEGKLDDALDSLAQGLKILPKDALRMHAEYQLQRGCLLIMSGQEDRSFLEAATAFKAIGDKERAAHVWMVYGFDLLEHERAEEAEEVFRNVIFECDSSQWLVLAKSYGYLGNVERYRENHRLAREHYQKALELLSQHQETQWASVFRMDLGLLYLIWGKHQQAKDTLKAAIEEMREKMARLYSLSMAAHACACAALGEPSDTFVLPESIQDESLRTVINIYRSGASLLQGQHISEQPMGEQSQHSILAQRFFAQAQQQALDDEDVYRIAHDGSHIVLPNKTTIDFSSRPVLASLVDTFAQAHHTNTLHSLEELFTRTWRQQASYSSMCNRVRVSLSTLRKMGLRDLIECKDGAYCFKESAHIERFNHP